MTYQSTQEEVEQIIWTMWYIKGYQSTIANQSDSESDLLVVSEAYKEATATTRDMLAAGVPSNIIGHAATDGERCGIASAKEGTTIGIGIHRPEEVTE